MRFCRTSFRENCGSDPKSGQTAQPTKQNGGKRLASSPQLAGLTTMVFNVLGCHALRSKILVATANGAPTNQTIHSTTTSPPKKVPRPMSQSRSVRLHAQVIHAPDKMHCQENTISSGMAANSARARKTAR